MKHIIATLILALATTSVFAERLECQRSATVLVADGVPMVLPGSKDVLVYIDLDAKKTRQKVKGKWEEKKLNEIVKGVYKISEGAIALLTKKHTYTEIVTADGPVMLIHTCKPAR